MAHAWCMLVEREDKGGVEARASCVGEAWPTRGTLVEGDDKGGVEARAAAGRIEMLVWVTVLNLCVYRSSWAAGRGASGWGEAEGLEEDVQMLAARVLGALGAERLVALRPLCLLEDEEGGGAPPGGGVVATARDVGARLAREGGRLVRVVARAGEHVRVDGEDVDLALLEVYQLDGAARCLARNHGTAAGLPPAGSDPLALDLSTEAAVEARGGGEWWSVLGGTEATSVVVNARIKREDAAASVLARFARRCSLRFALRRLVRRAMAGAGAEDGPAAESDPFQRKARYALIAEQEYETEEGGMRVLVDLGVSVIIAADTLGPNYDLLVHALNDFRKTYAAGVRQALGRADATVLALSSLLANPWVERTPVLAVAGEDGRRALTAEVARVEALLDTIDAERAWGGDAPVAALLDAVALLASDAVAGAERQVGALRAHVASLDRLAAAAPP
ncbi:hypothetical protein T484DRAFT_1893346, partial [Baffinella frigidus]